MRSLDLAVVPPADLAGGACGGLARALRLRSNCVTLLRVLSSGLRAVRAPRGTTRQRQHSCGQRPGSLWVICAGLRGGATAQFVPGRPRWRPGGAACTATQRGRVRRCEKTLLDGPLAGVSGSGGTRRPLGRGIWQWSWSVRAGGWRGGVKLHASRGHRGTEAFFAVRRR